MTKEFSEKVKLNAWTLIIMVLINVGSLAYDVIIKKNDLLADVTSVQEKTFISVFLICIIAVYVLVQLFVAFNYMNNANGKKTGNAHFTFNKILLVLSIFNVAYIIYFSLSGKESWSFWNNYLAILEVFIYGEFVMYEARLKEENKKLS